MTRPHMPSLITATQNFFICLGGIAAVAFFFNAIHTPLFALACAGFLGIMFLILYKLEVARRAVFSNVKTQRIGDF